MTINTTTITVQLPNGQPNTLTNPSVSACQLTANRMIIYSTSGNPYTRSFTIVDNANGLSSSTAPTVAYNAYMDTTNVGETNISVRMERLSDTTFVMMSPREGSLFVPTVWTIEVFTVVGTTITKVSSTTDNTFTLHARSAKSYQNMVVVPFSDYEIAVYYQYLRTSYNYYPYGMTSYWGAKRGVYDPNANTWTWGPARNLSDTPQYATTTWGDEGIYFPPNYVIPVDIWAIKSPDGGRLICAQSANGNNYSTRAAYSYDSYYADNFRYVYHSSATNLTAATLTDINDVKLYMTMGNAGASNWDGKTFNFAGTRPRQAVLANGTVGDYRRTLYTHTLPIDDNYLITIDRRFFLTNNPASNPFRMKLIRRIDGQLIEQSTASATNQAGFTVNVPWSDAIWDKPRPWLNENNDIVWWGILAGKFVITTIKQPSLPAANQN